MLLFLLNGVGHGRADFAALLCVSPTFRRICAHANTLTRLHALPGDSGNNLSYKLGQTK